MDVLIQRLVDLYVKTMDDTTPQNPVLARVHNLIRQAREMKAVAD